MTWVYPMKFLVTWTWKGKDGEENKAFTITEGNDIENIVKNIQPWTDVCTFKISPIIESRKLLAMD
jgi:hypothetical protein